MTSYAERLVEEGRAKGLAEGLERGIEKGLAEGLERGIEKGLVEGMEKGLQKGLEEGRANGMIQGEAEVLLRLLTRRFGEVPADVEQRIRAADGATLLRWSDRVLDAASLDAVLDDG